MPNDTDTMSNDFTPVLQSIFNEANAELKQAPDVLYHYTDAKGLLGIIDSGKFRATHFRYLNDPAEIVYAVPIIIDELNKMRGKVTGTGIQRALSKVGGTQQFVETIDDSILLDIFIASFSSEVNNSTQWEMYADKGNGFAIGINPKSTHYYDEFLIDLRPFKSPKYYLVKVIYDEEIQRKIITTSFNKLITFLEECDDSEISESVILEKIKSLIVLLAILFKHQSLEYENEWRFIHCRFPFPDFQLNLKDEVQHDNYLSFRCRNNSLIPFAKLDFRKEAVVAQAFDYDPNLKLMPLEKIYIGPYQQDHTKVKKAVINLLTAQGYDVVADLIEKCTIDK